MIIGTRLVFEQSDSRQNNEALSGFYPFAILIIIRKTTTVYQRFFQELHDAGGLRWKDDLWSGMTDMKLEISNAAKNVFPNSNWYLCWFHVSQNIIVKLDELKIHQNFSKMKSLIFQEIKKIHQSPTLKKAKKIISKLTSTLQLIQIEELQQKCSQFITYCETYYWCNDDTLTRWISHQNTMGKVMDATNNSIERFNSTLRDIIFRKKKLQKVEGVIKILDGFFGITKQTLGLTPANSLNSLSFKSSSFYNDLQFTVANTNRLANYINITMNSILGGKRKPK